MAVERVDSVIAAQDRQPVCVDRGDRTGGYREVVLIADRSQVANIAGLPLGDRNFPVARIGRALVRCVGVRGGQPNESLGQSAVSRGEEGVGSQGLHAYDDAGPVAMCGNHVAGVLADVGEA